MGHNKQLGRLVEYIQDLVGKVLEMQHIKDAKRTGVFIRVFDKETGDLLIGERFGLLTFEKLEKYSNFSHKKAFWFSGHPEAFSSAESRGEVPPGAISGRKYIVSVSGLNPNDDSSLAIIILAEIENKAEDFEQRELYIDRAECRSEIYSIVGFLASVYRSSVIDKFKECTFKPCA